MKTLLRTIFSFVLGPFESGKANYHYAKSHRVILIVIGCLFLGLAGIVFSMAEGQDIGYYFPVVIFSIISLLGFIIGFLGNERAVATIWGNIER